MEFGNAISEELMHTISAFNQLILQKPFTGLITTVAAYTSLTVFFDPIKVIQTDLPGKTALQKVTNHIKQLKQTDASNTKTDINTITIPVYYGGNFGPDLEHVASINYLTIDEVIRIHTSAIYLVHMIGFVPGFAYLGGMPPTIAAPRKATPRAAIPAGAVGIAGLQTGIYPLQTPGGWQIIGQTPLKMFDANRPLPSLLKAGDQVVFKSISADAFENYQNS